MSDPLLTDLRLVFPREHPVDLDLGPGDLATVSGLDNLVQALQLRLLIHRGHLSHLGHDNYGSRVADLIGEPLDRGNLRLLERYARQAILADPRVAKIHSITAIPRTDELGAVDLDAEVEPITGGRIAVGVTLDVG